MRKIQQARVISYFRAISVDNRKYLKRSLLQISLNARQEVCSPAVCYIIFSHLYLAILLSIWRETRIPFGIKKCFFISRKEKMQQKLKERDRCCVSKLVWEISSGQMGKVKQKRRVINVCLTKFFTNKFHLSNLA